jgi:hypothetical protein
MVIAKIWVVGFVENDNQTVGFQKLCKVNLGMDKAKFNRYYREPSDGNYHWLVGATEDECVKKFQAYIKKEISRTIPGADFSYFFFRLITSDTDESGFFWKPCGRTTRTYRLSDLEIIQ